MSPHTKGKEPAPPSHLKTSVEKNTLQQQEQSLGRGGGGGGENKNSTRENWTLTSGTLGALGC